MWDPYGEEEQLRFARYLAKSSLATRVIGLVVVVVACILIVVAQGMSGSSDRMGFSIMALVTVLFGTLVWGVGVFHGAVGRTIPSVVRIERSLAVISHAARPPQQPSHALAPAAPAADPVRAEPAPAEVAMTAADTEEQPRPARAARPAKPSDTEVQRVPCPLCGGLTHPQATRCVHCMRKLTR